MKTINMLLKLLMLLSGTASLLVSTTEAVEVDQACYGLNQALQCSQHRLQCQQGSIFILKAARGFKQRSNDCPVQRASCTNPDLCCHNTSSDCLEDYTQDAFSDLAAECWSKSSCSYRISEANTARCSNNYKSSSGYSNVGFLCLQDQTIQDFSDSKKMIATSMALRYQYSAEPGDYVCLLEAGDCSTRTVDIMLVKNPNLYSSRPCTSLSVSNTDGLPCDAQKTRYATYTISTPSNVSLYVSKRNDVRHAWAVIHGHDAIELQITCARSGSPFSGCSSSITTSKQTATLQNPLSSTAAAATTSAIMADDRQKSLENCNRRTWIVGGTLGVAVVLVVVACICAMWWCWRLRPFQH